MQLSLNWLRDYVDLPPDLDPRELGERFTVSVAEVDDVRPISVRAQGLIAACVLKAEHLPGTRNLRLVTLDVGGGRRVETVSAAPAIHVHSNVVYAPPGASVAGLGTINSANVAGRTSTGMVLPGESVGIAMAAQEAVFLDDSVRPGQALSTVPFDDWIVEIDNKAITNRPDLWGHYGVAREIAALLGLPLKPYPVVSSDDLNDRGLPTVAISIADAAACPRYSAIVLSGVPTQPAPLWMQLRLGHVGMRPISGLVDLTNYVMADLGQPMHAFDAELVDRIEVDWAADGESFTTLDGVERTLDSQTLMIKRKGESIALAGVMGGLETEVSERTSRLLLESANFDAATIRRTAQRLGMRTDASARFEKSLDPENTVLGIRRFLFLASQIYSRLGIESRLSDDYPEPRDPLRVAVRPDHVDRALGRGVGVDEARRLLEPLAFRVRSAGDRWSVDVPTFRATGDVSIEADVIEELARRAGYNEIQPQMPVVSIRRFAPNALHELEQRTLAYFATAYDFHEIQSYLWFNAPWIAQLGVETGSCITLRNPPAEGQEQLRWSLQSGLLAAVALNRFHFPKLSIMELGSVFERSAEGDREIRHLGLILARRGRRVERELYDRLKGALEGWVWDRLARQVHFRKVEADRRCPWEHIHQTAGVTVDGRDMGRVSVVDLSLRQAMDEHLVPWGIAWAEIDLSAFVEIAPRVEPLAGIPAFPRVELDFSFVVPGSERYARVVEHVSAFEHPLLKYVRFVGSYEGESIGPGRRSITIRAVVGDDERTLVEDDTISFVRQFEEHLARFGYEIRK
ncbi:MAG: phenylalanine--tRNA ligase subunit beta [Phycisphaerae bacterium]|nr:phenylalanine--tRNA ligase subunit beta [Phycisphaerae bacterium]